MDQNQRALALAQVAVDLLSVERLVADQVEQVVLDLERRAQVEPEPHHRPEVGPPTRPQQRPYPQGVDGRVPARLVHDEVEVVLGRQPRHGVAAPAELGRLALEGPQRHGVELVEQAFAQVVVEAAGVLPQHLVRQDGERVARR